MEIFSFLISFTFLAQVLRLFTPYFLGASAANFSERGGVINISIEGFMISSAFSYGLFSVLTGDVIISFFAAIIVNLLFS
jgi:simple sugar transport system permease protein